jgi:hypothetical protein
MCCLWLPNVSSAPPCALPASNGTLQAPIAAHALAHPTPAVDKAWRRHEAADPAAVGRETPAIAAPAPEIAGADDLTVAIGCAGPGLRDRNRGEARSATDGERQSPRACISHRDCPGNTAFQGFTVAKNGPTCNAWRRKGIGLGAGRLPGASSCARARAYRSRMNRSIDLKMSS